MTKAPLPDSVRIGKVSLAVFQTVTFFLKSNPFSGICIDCVAELYYIGTFNMPARPSEYHQNDDVAETVAKIPFVASTEIGDRAVQNSSIVPGYCPVVRFFLLHLRCD